MPSASAWLVSLALCAPLAVAWAAPWRGIPHAGHPRARSGEVRPRMEEDVETYDDPAAEEAPAEPDAPAEAERWFLEGQRLFREGRYGAAAEAFARSFAAVPVPSTLYNMALAHERAGDLVAALHAYRRYLAESSPSAARRAEVQAVVERLEGRVARLELSIPPDVEIESVRLDDEVVPVAAFPMELMPGTVQLALVAPDGAVQRQTVGLAPGRTVRVQVAPFVSGASREGDGPPAPTVSGPPTASSPRPDGGAAARRRSIRAAFWVGLGATAASGVAVAVLGSLALRSARRFNEDKCPEVCTPELMQQFPDYPEDERQRALRLQTATNAMIGVTAGLGLATTILGVVAFGKRKAPGRADLRLQPRLTGLSLSGRF